MVLKMNVLGSLMIIRVFKGTIR